MKVKLGRELVPGDVILMGDNGARDVRTTVLRTGERARPDLFGRVFDAVWVRREDDGREGLVSYGPEGAFVLAPGTATADARPLAIALAEVDRAQAMHRNTQEELRVLRNLAGAVRAHLRHSAPETEEKS